MNAPGRFLTDGHRPVRSKPLERRVATLTARLREAERDAYRRGIEDAISVMLDRMQRCGGGMIDAEQTRREIIARLLTDEGRAAWR
jgi:hypothetical protein